MNRGMKVLQTFALPLGYVTIFRNKAMTAPFLPGAEAGTSFYYNAED